METDGIPLEMEVNTGASLSLVAEDTYWCHWTHTELPQSQLRLCTYSGELGSDGEFESESTSWWPRHQSSTDRGEGKWAKSPWERLAGASARSKGGL